MSDSETIQDTCTPILLEIVAKLPVRYGDTAWGFRNSFVLARVNACISRVDLDKTSEPTTLGTLSGGVLELAGSKYGSSQLVG